MFPSVCSLRSTQCAALIALAAAAGIMRIEPGRFEHAATPSPTTEHAHRPADESTRIASYFQSSLASFAPWLLLQLATELTEESESQGTIALSPSLVAPEPFASELKALVPSARQHSFPFAVGPPPTRFTSTPSVDDTNVSDDSAARWMLASRIAVYFSAFDARISRDGNPVQILARAYSEPSSALRGEPEAIAPPVTLVAPAGLSRCRSHDATTRFFSA